MRKYIIGTVSALDKPLSPLMKGETAIARHFKQISNDIIQKHREEVFGTEKKNIQDLSSIMEEVLNKKMISIIEENVRDGEISLLRINESFRRIQKLKKKIGLIN